MNESFKIVYEFKNPGDEIIALDVYQNAPAKIHAKDQEIEHSKDLVIENQKIQEIYIKFEDKNFGGVHTGFQNKNRDTLNEDNDNANKIEVELGKVSLY